MSVSSLILVATAALAGLAVHPQDGPHADIRIAVTDEHVRFSVGVNLAFLDEVCPVPREAEDAVHDSEVEELRAAFESFIAERNRVAIDGVEVGPLFESFDMFTQPEPARVVLFPRTGMRGLIRAVAVIDYPTKQAPLEIELTWGGFPPDILSPEFEAGEEPPPMFLEAQLRAEGVLSIIRFSEAEPTCTWRSMEAGGGSLLADVPTPPEGQPARTVPAVSLAAALVGLVAAGSAVAGLARGRRFVPAGALAVACLVTAVSTTALARVTVPGTASPPPLPDDDAVAAVFGPLHANLYRAFDYTEESDIYDALARSVQGPLLDELYDAIYRSLVQAEQGGMLGVVTGVEPLELEILEVVPGAPEDEATARFRVRHRWRVAGTVYHWGHSHTRRHEYLAEYEVAAVDAGWRITAHRMLEQIRLDLLEEI